MEKGRTKASAWILEQSMAEPRSHVIPMEVGRKHGKVRNQEKQTEQE